MATYFNIMKSVYAEFNDPSWVSNGLKAYPADFNGDKNVDEYVTISVIVASSGPQFGGGKGPQDGMLLCEIYTETGHGQTRTAYIADLLDGLLENKFLDASGVRFQTSFIGTPAQDTSNAALSRAIYTLPFKTLGENS